MQYLVDCTCAEELELGAFPFDVQFFGLHFQCKDKSNLRDVLPFPRRGCFFSLNASFSVVGEWSVLGMMNEFECSGKSKTKVAYARWSLVMRAERKWETHRSLILVTMAMYFLAIGMFAIAVDEIGDRLGYAITLVLADVATLQLLNESMPNIPYETILDAYSLVGMIFLLVLTIYSCVVGYNSKKRISSRFDTVAMGAFCVLCLAIQVYFYRLVILTRQRERRKLRMTTAEVERMKCEEQGNMSAASSVPVCQCDWAQETQLSDTKHEIHILDLPGVENEDDDLLTVIQESFS